MESQQYLSQNTCPQYLIKAETRLKEEAARVIHYLSPLTESKLLRYVEIELITNHVRTLVDMDSSGCVCLMRDDKVDDLKRMYDLFKRDHSQNTLDILRECMFTYVKECGYAIIGNQENLNDPIAFVQQILELRNKMENITVNSFRSDKKTLKKLKDSFEDFMNKDIKCASHLVRDCPERTEEDIQRAKRRREELEEQRNGPKFAGLIASDDSNDGGDDIVDFEQQIDDSDDDDDDENNDDDDDDDKKSKKKKKRQSKDNDHDDDGTGKGFSKKYKAEKKRY